MDDDASRLCTLATRLLWRGPCRNAVSDAVCDLVCVHDLVGVVEFSRDSYRVEATGPHDKLDELVKAVRALCGDDQRMNVRFTDGGGLGWMFANDGKWAYVKDEHGRNWCLSSGDWEYLDAGLLADGEGA